MVRQREVALLEIAGQQPDDPAGQLIAARMDVCRRATGNGSRSQLGSHCSSRHRRSGLPALQPSSWLIRPPIERSTAERSTARANCLRAAVRSTTYGR